MPFIRLADPFAPQTQRRCGPAQAQGRCGRRQHPQPQQASGSGINPILDFFSALEKELSTTEQSQTPQPKPKKIISPNFDVIETENAYILQGNLPGVHDKKSIEIDFSDVQTLVVKGEVTRRNIATSTASSAVSDEKVEQHQVADEQLPVYSESSSSKDTSDTVSTHSLQPTVEETIDESESDGSDNEFEVVDSPSTLKASSSSPAPASTVKPEEPLLETQEEAEAEKQTPHTPQQAQATSQAQAQSTATIEKFWLNERPVGVFERAFKFEHLIDQDAVTATLEYGVLEIVVPKREKYVRRVVIQ